MTQNSPQEEKSLDLTLLFVGAILFGILGLIGVLVWWIL